MSTLKTDLTTEKAPLFCLPTLEDKQICLEDCLGQYVVLYFYPKDNTPGCTKESLAFSDALPAFKAHNAHVFGISRDTLAAHQKFTTKYDLQVPLLSDEQDVVCRQYGVVKEKSLFGKTALGIERSTFLIDPAGQVVATWRKVKVAGHVEAVLEALKQHQGASGG